MFYSQLGVSHKMNIEFRMTFNSLRPYDAIWPHGTRSTLVQVMACCLTAPSHYLNQCWLIIGEVPWDSSQGIILRWCEDTNQSTRLKIAVLKWHLGLPWANELSNIYEGKPPLSYFTSSYRVSSVGKYGGCYRCDWIGCYAWRSINILIQTIFNRNILDYVLWMW